MTEAEGVKRKGLEKMIPYRQLITTMNAKVALCRVTMQKFIFNFAVYDDDCDAIMIKLLMVTVHEVRVNF